MLYIDRKKTYSFVSVVIKAAVMSEHKPPLPPAFQKTGLSAFVQVASTSRLWSVRCTTDIGADGQNQKIRAYMTCHKKHNLRSFMRLIIELIVWWAHEHSERPLLMVRSLPSILYSKYYLAVVNLSLALYCLYS